MNKLGRGLQSLIPPKQKSAEVEYPKISQPLRDRKESIFNLEISKISPNPHQPRLEMDENSLKELASSIKQHGILQPVIVTKVIKETRHGQDVEYELIAGHRRFEAAKLIGLPTIPALVRDTTEQQKLELALVENLQRADLNPIERAKAFKKLGDEFGLTHEEIGKRVGRSREGVTNVMRLLNLPDVIQKNLERNKISEGHARAIAGIKNPAAQMALFNEILENNLSVRELEDKAREVSVQAHKRRLNPDQGMVNLEKKLELFLNRKVRIRNQGPSGAGQVVINFEDKEDLEKITKKIVG